MSSGLIPGDKFEQRQSQTWTTQTLQSGQDNITAHAGGGQQAASPLSALLNRVTVVTTAGDSVTLPASLAGADIMVVNAAGLNSMNVFPNTGDQINALGANAAFAVAAGKTAVFYCVTAGQWHSILSA